MNPFRAFVSVDIFTRPASAQEHDVKFSFKVLPLSFILLGSSFPLYAEDELPTLVVSASRSDQVRVPHASSIKLITREEIELSGAKSLPELLRGQPGVYVSDLFGDGSNATVDMRGFGSTANANTLIMVDGRKLNFATDMGTIYFNSIDMDNVEQVEIIQGSSGILFGNMAVGGVINVITRKPVDNVIEAQLDIGSYNSHKERVRFENILANGWSSRVIISNRESDNYRDHNEAETQSASLRLDRHFTGGKVFVEYEYLDDYLETPGALFLDEIEQDRRQSVAAYANDYQDLKNQLLRVGGSLELWEQSIFQFEAGFNDSDREFISNYRTSLTPEPVTFQDRQTLDLNFRYLWSVDKFQNNFGVDLQKTDYSLLSRIGPQDLDQDIAALYFQTNYEINKSLDMSFGIRHAHVWNDIYLDDGFGLISYSDQIDDQVTVGSFGLNYNLNDHSRLYILADQNYRFAKVEEQSETINYPDVGLKTQKGISYQIGYEAKKSGFDYSLLLYMLDLENEISYDATNYGNLNLDKTRRVGLTLSLQKQLNENVIFGGVYDYLDSEITDGPHEGNEIPEVSDKRASLFVEYYPASDVSFKAEGLYVGDRYYGGDFGNIYQKMDSYSVFNIAGQYLFENITFNLRLNNVFDKEYSESGAIGYDSFWSERPAEFTAPERNLWLGVKVSL